MAGRWHARRWITGEWIEHRVTLTRQGGRLACAQEFRAWFGDRNATVPPRCPDGGFSYYRVLLDCDAQQRGDALEVRSATVRDLRHTCGGNLSRYNLDHLTGTVDGNQWDATNNDGADDIDARYRFVRLSCEP